MAVFLNGAVAMGCAVAGLIFLRFWRDSGEQLFVAFALAFWIFAINYGLLGVMPLADERRPLVFILRLIGFVIILLGIAHKNRLTRN